MRHKSHTVDIFLGYLSIYPTCIPSTLVSHVLATFMQYSCEEWHPTIVFTSHLPTAFFFMCICMGGGSGEVVYVRIWTWQNFGRINMIAWYVCNYISTISNATCSCINMMNWSDSKTDSDQFPPSLDAPLVNPNTTCKFDSFTTGKAVGSADESDQDLFQSVFSVHGPLTVILAHWVH